MNCREADNLLIDLLYGELAPPVAAVVESHLSSCSACAARRAELELTREVWRREIESVEPPPHVDAAILAAARAHLPAPARAQERAEEPTILARMMAFLLGPVGKPALAFAMVAVVVGAVFYFKAPGHRAAHRFAAGKGGGETWLAPAPRKAGSVRPAAASPALQAPTVAKGRGRSVVTLPNRPKDLTKAAKAPPGGGGALAGSPKLPSSAAGGDGALTGASKGDDYGAAPSPAPREGPAAGLAADSARLFGRKRAALRGGDRDGARKRRYRRSRRRRRRRLRRPRRRRKVRRRRWARRGKRIARPRRRPSVRERRPIRRRLPRTRTRLARRQAALRRPSARAPKPAPKPKTAPAAARPRGARRAGQAEKETARRARLARIARGATGHRRAGWGRRASSATALPKPRSVVRPSSPARVIPRTYPRPSWATPGKSRGSLDQLSWRNLGRAGAGDGSARPAPGSLGGARTGSAGRPDDRAATPRPSVLPSAGKRTRGPAPGRAAKKEKPRLAPPPPPRPPSAKSAGSAPQPRAPIPKAPAPTPPALTKKGGARELKDSRPGRKMAARQALTPPPAPAVREEAGGAGSAAKASQKMKTAVQAKAAPSGCTTLASRYSRVIRAARHSRYRLSSLERVARRLARCYARRGNPAAGERLLLAVLRLRLSRSQRVRVLATLRDLYVASRQSTAAAKVLMEMSRVDPVRRRLYKKQLRRLRTRKRAVRPTKANGF